MTEKNWFPNLETSARSDDWFDENSKNTRFKFLIGLIDELALILIPLLGLFYFLTR